MKGAENDNFEKLDEKVELDTSDVVKRMSNARTDDNNSITEKNDVIYRDKQISLLKDFFKKVDAMNTNEADQSYLEKNHIIDIVKRIVNTMENTGGRIMYHEVSNLYFNDKYGQNEFIDKLEGFLRILYDNNGKQEHINFVYKIIDHLNLAQIQMGKIQEYCNLTNEKSIEEMNKQLEDEGKKIISKMHKNLNESSKQYITILGIFASIVLAFTGGVAFSTSVLSNIESASIYRLVFIISLLGFILFNTICVMFEFVREINDKEMGLSLKNIFKKPLWLIPNVVLASIMIISTLAYYLGKM